MFREDKILLTLYLGASLVAQMVKTLHAIQKPGWDPWIGKIPWRRKRQPTPVFLTGKFHGQRSLGGYSAWGRKKSDMIEGLTLSHSSAERKMYPHSFVSSFLPFLLLPSLPFLLPLFLWIWSSLQVSTLPDAESGPRTSIQSLGFLC